MNKSISHYISELLFLHDCVIIPDFGGFVGNRKSAQLNKKTGVLTPPTKQILFNTNLKTNDGLLISHISNQERISQHSAKNHVIKFATECSEKLNQSKVLRIDKVGLLTQGKDENIVFFQDNSTNYSLDAYGMQKTYPKTVKKQEKIEDQVAATVTKIENTHNKTKLFLRAASIIIPLITLSYISISQQENINTIYTQMAMIKPLASNNIIEKATEVVVLEKTPEIKKENPKNENNLIPIIKSKNYYIIAGSFSERKNANKMLNKLLSWDYNAEIVEGTLLRVSYDSFSSREEAVLTLNKIKRENTSAWLLAQ